MSGWISFLILRCLDGYLPTPLHMCILRHFMGILVHLMISPCTSCLIIGDQFVDTHCSVACMYSRWPSPGQPTMFPVFNTCLWWFNSNWHTCYIWHVAYWHWYKIANDRCPHLRNILRCGVISVVIANMCFEAHPGPSFNQACKKMLRASFYGDCSQGQQRIGDAKKWRQNKSSAVCAR